MKQINLSSVIPRQTDIISRQFVSIVTVFSSCFVVTVHTKSK
jgi:hypothetical protein